MEKTKKSLAFPKHLPKPKKLFVKLCKQPCKFHKQTPKITLYNAQKDMRLSLAMIKRVLQRCLEILNISTDEVIFHFVSTRRISALHRRFFDDPSPTDCITVPIDPLGKQRTGYHLLGEVFICPKVAKHYAQEHDLPVFEELIRYAVHGLLHLIGYDDMQLKDARAMKKKEEDIMKQLSNLLS
jgi:probable rRNA maturation factor